jgi:dienelactone hydrolase
MMPFRAQMRTFLAVAVLAALGSAALAQSTPAAGDRSTIISIPSPERRSPMRTLVLRPPGPGPFPLALINHGSTQNPERRTRMETPQYRALSKWFLDRGYIVALPQRPGHGKTGGTYLEDQHGCDRANFRQAGYGAADSIETALRYMTALPDVRRTGVIVVGQSAGAWGALALASRRPQAVAAVINFAGGRGGHSFDRPNVNCAPDRLVDAARHFGRTARVPTLWIYTENDSYFAPALSKRMVDAYRGAGGLAEYRLLPPFGSDGHQIIEASSAVPQWGPLVENFLKRMK